MVCYKQTTEELYAAFGTSDNGLSEARVLEHRKKYGSNQLALKKEPFWRILLEPFRSIFVLVLIVAAAISLLSHESLDAIIIGMIVMINASIYWSQQYATTRVLRTLRKHSEQCTNVIRGGNQFMVSAVDLVPGDIVVLNEGERIPADARIIHVDNLQTDEATITGESLPVHKHASTLVDTKQIFEQDNMVFQGTYVLGGTAKALVVSTGSKTEFGKIAGLASDDHTKSPVQTKIDNLVTLMIKIVGVLAIIVFVLSLIRGIPANEALRFVLSLTVSAAPEGLPVALTVIIVLGMRRMAKQKALVRSFRAIEDIGLVTTIATDKTGTLTKNHLTIVESWDIDGNDVEGIAIKTLDANTKLSDPLDLAIKEKSNSDLINEVDRIYPFDISIRMSGAYIEKDKTIYIKGSPEHILAKSNLTKEQHLMAESAMHELASQGFRVIAFAKHKVSGQPPESLDSIQKDDLGFIGFIAFADELRPEAAGAIRAAQEAGISVRLITGDHFETAYNIGKKIGLANHPSQVVVGKDLPSDSRALSLAIQGKTIFARILPEDKFNILKALKHSEVTAMTGDGVNDVPALVNANVGIAMGSGSDIAKDAGGIILLNDNFATIVKAIAEGRKIFDNIRRMIFYLLSTSLGEVLTMIGALLFGLPLPVTAIQILWINLVTETAMVLPLGLEPEEDGYMKRPPRRPKDPLLNKILISRVIIIALTMAVITLVIVAILNHQGQSSGYIQTVAFMALIAAQWMNAFNARSENKSSFSRIKKINHGLAIGFSIALAFQVLVMFGPLGPMLGIQDVPIATLAISSGAMALSILAVSEIHKWLARLLIQGNSKQKLVN